MLDAETAPSSFERGHSIGCKIVNCKLDRVQHDLGRGLEKGRPVRSLNFSEPGLAEFFTELEEIRRNRPAANGGGGGGDS
jgi:hypothetical protein